MSTVGVDPSNSWVGLARADGERLAELVAVRCFPGEPERTVHERIRPWMPRDPRGWSLVLEEPPPASRANHGRQAPIGYAVGYMSGLIAAGWPPRAVSKVQVSAWRDAMIVLAARRGLLLEKPTRRPKPKGLKGRMGKLRRAQGRPGLVVTWLGCDHEQVFESLSALQANTPPACPDCAGVVVEADGMDDHEWRRDEWKRIACHGIAELWPGLYQPVVDDARSRARSNRPDHRLEGVADACEAAWIAVTTGLIG